MEDLLWYLFASSRGGGTRAEIIKALQERPYNANELAESLGYDYTTIRHHLKVMADNNLVRSTEQGYGDVYLLTAELKAHQEELQTVLDTVRGE